MSIQMGVIVMARKRICSPLLVLALMLAVATGVLLATGTNASAMGPIQWDRDMAIEENSSCPGGVELTTDVTVTIAKDITFTVTGGLDTKGYTLTVAGEGEMTIEGWNGNDGVGGDNPTAGSQGGIALNGNVIVDGATIGITGGNGGVGGQGDDGAAGGAGGSGITGNLTVMSGEVLIYGGNGGNGGKGTGDYTSGFGVGGQGGTGGCAINGSVVVNGGKTVVAGGEAGNGGAGSSTNGEKSNGSNGIEGSLTVTDGSILVAGGDYSEEGTWSLEEGPFPGKAVTGGIIAKTIKESDDGENWTVVSGKTSDKQFVTVEGGTEPEPAPSSGHEMFRLYNPNSGEHFYTASPLERDNVIAAGWNDEGVGWTAPADGAPVYRLYNANAGEHHYTTSPAERDALVAVGWNDEGIGWRSADTNGAPIFRQYNPNAFANNHNFTGSSFERDSLLELGWNDEGIAWYGMRVLK